MFVLAEAMRDVKEAFSSYGKSDTQCNYNFAVILTIYILEGSNKAYASGLKKPIFASFSY